MSKMFSLPIGMYYDIPSHNITYQIPKMNIKFDRIYVWAQFSLVRANKKDWVMHVKKILSSCHQKNATNDTLYVCTYHGWKILVDPHIDNLRAAWHHVCLGLYNHSAS